MRENEKYNRKGKERETHLLQQKEMELWEDFRRQKIVNGFILYCETVRKEVAKC